MGLEMRRAREFAKSRPRSSHVDVAGHGESRVSLGTLDVLRYMHVCVLGWKDDVPGVDIACRRSGVSEIHDEAGASILCQIAAWSPIV